MKLLHVAVGFLLGGASMIGFGLMLSAPQSPSAVRVTVSEPRTPDGARRAADALLGSQAGYDVHGFCTLLDRQAMYEARSSSGTCELEAISQASSYQGQVVIKKVRVVGRRAFVHQERDGDPETWVFHYEHGRWLEDHAREVHGVRGP